MVTVRVAERGAAGNFAPGPRLQEGAQGGPLRGPLRKDEERGKEKQKKEREEGKRKEKRGREGEKETERERHREREIEREINLKGPFTLYKSLFLGSHITYEVLTLRTLLLKASCALGPLSYSRSCF